MKLTRNLIFGLMAATSAVAVAGVGVTVAQEGLGFKNAEAVTPMRRIWVVNQNGGWWPSYKDGDTTYAGFKVHAWQDGVGNEVDLPLVQCHGNDYWAGSFFCDIPATSTHVVFFQGNWAEKTDDLKLPTYGSADVWYLSENRRTPYNNRACSVGTMPMSTGQLAHLMGYFDTCSDSQANGYMAYPQMMADFVTPSTSAVLTEEIADGGPVDQGYNGKLPTIQEKLHAMRLKYEAATK